MKKFYAAYASTTPEGGPEGPAFGIGSTPDAAIKDGEEWADGAALEAIEVSLETFLKIQDGNPDA